jgi:hypothetical protein
MVEAKRVAAFVRHHADGFEAPSFVVRRGYRDARPLIIRDYRVAPILVLPIAVPSRRSPWRLPYVISRMAAKIE